MKKFQIFSVLTLVLVFSTSLCAQRYVETKHFVGLNLEAGGWVLLPGGNSKLSTAGGPGAELGFVYEFQRKHLIFQTGVGAEFGMATFHSDSADVVQLGAKDMHGEHFEYTYEFGRRTDRYIDVAVEVPLLLGGQWNRFYFLGGAKMKYHVFTRSNVEGNFSTYGLYERFDPFRNMPEYEFVDNMESTQAVASGLNLDIALSAEIGFRLGEIYQGSGFDVPKQRTQYRLAIFADYGLLNIHRNGTKNAIETPAVYTAHHMLDGVRFNDVLSTTYANGKLNNLLVGVKFTVLFQVGHGKEWCLICKDNPHPARSGKGGKILTEL